MPLYDSLGESSVEFIINHAEAGIVFTSTEKLPLLEKAVAAIKKNVKHIVVFGEPTDASTKAWKAAESAVSCDGGAPPSSNSIVVFGCQVMPALSRPRRRRLLGGGAGQG